MIADNYDAVVIGAGSGGLTVAVGLARFGRKVLLVERGPIGGDCTNVGCIPSKTLLSLAARHGTDRSTSEILAEVRARRTDLSAHEQHDFGSMDGIELVAATARLLGGGRVELTPPMTPTPATVNVVAQKHVISATDIIVATGSAPRQLKIDGLDPERILTNETFFEQERLPARLVNVGGGAVGLEMAVAARRLGSAVAVVEAAPRFLGMIPPEAADTLTTALADTGIELMAGTMVRRFANGGLETVGPGGQPGFIADVDAVLTAVGRIPNTEGLGLEAAGVEQHPSGHVVVDDKARTTAPGVWAVGDVTTNGGTTHAANAWGRRMVVHQLVRALPARSEPARPFVIFTDPEVASLGNQPDVAPPEVMRITVDLTEMDRGYTEGLRHGILIVDVRRFTGQIEGVTIVGPGAGELLATFSLADKAGVPFHRFYGTVFAYPTYAWAIQKAVDIYVGATAPRLHTQFGHWLRAKTPRRSTR